MVTSVMKLKEVAIVNKTLEVFKGTLIAVLLFEYRQKNVNVCTYNKF